MVIAVVHWPQLRTARSLCTANCGTLHDLQPVACDGHHEIDDFGEIGGRDAGAYRLTLSSLGRKFVPHPARSAAHIVNLPAALACPLGMKIDPGKCQAYHRTFPNSCCCRATSDIASDRASSRLLICSSAPKERAISRCCCNRAFSSCFDRKTGSSNSSHICLFSFSMDSLMRLKRPNSCANCRSTF
jgi:hypothetical protein